MAFRRPSGLRLTRALLILGPLSTITPQLAGSVQPVAGAGGVERSVRVQVRDSAGEFLDGLVAADFRVLLDGAETPLQRLDEIDRERDKPLDPAFSIRLVIYISDKLDVREKFRARRAVGALVPMVKLKSDSAAIYSNGALSGFTQDPVRLRELAFFFGEEVDRLGFGLPSPPPTPWRKSWPTGGARPDPRAVAAALRPLVERGVRGRLSETLSLLKPLPEWKVLFYFGRDVPYRNEELERHDLRSASRILGDAGFTVFAFNPSGTADAGALRMSTWAGQTGGRSVNASGDLRQAVTQAWRGLNHSYRLVYQSPETLDCRWHEVKVNVGRAGAAAPPAGGYFDTVDAALTLIERTYLTAALNPEKFSDFPLELAAAVEPADPSASEIATGGRVKVALRFPFSVAAEEGVTIGPEERFHQRFLFYLGVFDAQGTSLGDFSSPAFFDLDAEQLEKALSELARLDQDIEVSHASAQYFLLAIVVVGQNERFSTRILRFTNGNPN